MALLICHISVKLLYFLEKNYSAKENIKNLLQGLLTIRIGSSRVTVLKSKKNSRKPITDLQMLLYFVRTYSWDSFKVHYGREKLSKQQKNNSKKI
jgi:hypothetical protein